jgi:hemolysin III
MAAEKLLPDKPRLRGWLHQVAFLTSIPIGLLMVATAGTTEATVAAAVYALGVTALYGTSAAYHRFDWSARARRWMRRLDHSMIFVLIAATYTPVCLLALEGSGAVVNLVVIWSGALLGVLFGLTGIAEKPGVGFTLYLTLGWVATFSLPALLDGLGGSRFTLVAVGGIVYTLGAVCLGTKWPDPRPAVFGYHEVWHAATLVAGACFLIVNWGLVLGATS